MTPRAGGRRRPAWVYDGGEEPDYRFSFANERTYLAWLRTALALIASGVAVDLVAPPETDGRSRVLAVLLVALGMLCALLAVVRWARAERAMRHGQPLPGFTMVVMLPAGLVVTGLVLWFLLW
ncbi:YidH family protein [Nocardioides sp. R1-1]|uniref:YidH family protein n=1 Tax=Nocardioides sp. R1-1 TaxID=3383502 RepID=UPI0038D0034E